MQIQVFILIANSFAHTIFTSRKQQRFLFINQTKKPVLLRILGS